MNLTEKQLEQIRAQIRRVKACGNPFYTERFKNVNPEDIKTQKDFEKHLNEDVEISLYAPIDKLKKFEAKLVSYNGDNIDVEYKGKKLNLNIKDIAVIHVAIKF